jgi:UDP-N-acetylmuramoyl-tripeptide--D-alanyl-D-alanine ligase
MQLVQGTYSAADLVGAVHGTQLAGDPARRLGPASIDSRSIAPGDVFFAIVAARDGHAYVSDAVGKGAGAIVVHKDVAVAASADAQPVVVRVADTLTALHDLGRSVRRASGARVVAITGSAGKTTTKDAIAAVLSARYRVVKNRGNLNNHLGLPLSLIEMRERPDVAVMELGMNHAGEIRVLVGLAEPDIRVWTNVGDAHIGYFGSRDAIADAKAEILELATPASVLVCNADDALVMARVAGFPGRTIAFGTVPSAAVRAVEIDDAGIDGTTATVQTPAGSVVIQVPLPGRGHLMNALAAIAVGLELGVDPASIADRIRALAPGAHRGVRLTTPTGATVLDDSYNSSPSALMRALDALAATPARGRRVAVLGEMLELGDHAIALHEACGRHAAQVGLHRLVTVGGEPARRLGAAAIAAGMDASAVAHADAADAAAPLVGALHRGDVVLVKGSRGIQTERVVARLTTERT